MAWGRVVGGRPAFEDLALRLVEAGDAGALEAFLATKLVLWDQRALWLELLLH
jgi:hypothetical protein